MKPLFCSFALLFGFAASVSAQVTYPVGAVAVNGIPNQNIAGIIPSGVNNEAANGVTDDSAALSAGCTGGREISLTRGGNYFIGTNTTLSCHLHSNGWRFTVGNGVTLTLNGTVTAPAAQIFSLQGTGLVAFGTATTEVPVEWFGAVGDAGYGVAGTDNTVAIQNAINSLSSGHIVLSSKFYRTTAPLVINKGNVGIRGTDAGYTGLNGPYAPVSVIMNTTASSDIVDVQGTSTNYAAWGDFRFFSVMRSVTPSGTATGLSFNYAGGYSIDHVQSIDSIRDFYFHAGPNFGVGSIRNANAGWGGSGIGGYSGLSTYGWYLDSADGVAENSIEMNNISASCNASAGCGTNYGLYIYGTAINDVDVDFFNNAGSSFGIYIKDPGGSTTAALPAYDLHFHNVTLDGWATSGVYISGATAALMGGITFTDGYVESLNAGTAHGFDIEGSSGVIISNVEIDNQRGDGVYSNGSANLAINGNLFSQTTGNFITLSSTTNSTIQGNILRGDASWPTATMIALTNSPTNTITGNTLAGYGTTGISFDSASASMQGGNTIDGGHISTLISDPSNVSYFAGSRIGASVQPTEAIDSIAAVRARGSVQSVGGDASSAMLDEAGTNQARILSVGSSTLSGGVTLAGITSASSNYTPYMTCAANGGACVFGTTVSGPATAPSGTCSVIGWVFSQDGHATFCNGTTYQTKI